MISDASPLLLVEDNPDDEELTILGLGAGLRHRVDVARDGQEALDYLFGTAHQAARPPPVVVLLDLKLPRIGGLDILKRIRGEQRTSRLPVVILTSSNEERDLVSAYDLGANSYVCKPIAFDDFTATVRELGVYWLTINERPIQPADQAEGDTWPRV